MASVLYTDHEVLEFDYWWTEKFNTIKSAYHVYDTGTSNIIRENFLKSETTLKQHAESKIQNVRILNPDLKEEREKKNHHNASILEEFSNQQASSIYLRRMRAISSS